MPSHFEKLAGHRRLPLGLVGARFMSRHVCEVLRKVSSDAAMATEAILMNAKGHTNRTHEVAAVDLLAFG